PPMQFVTWRDVSDISFNFEEIHDRIANTLEANPASNPLQLKYYGALMIAAFLIFVGTMGKSAQFPLHIWLPDAMEGPTPVSALIHAATMVAAGVYLIARTYFIFDPLNVSVSPALLALAVIGGFTAFWAATIGLAQYDIKRVLAFSTLSQLGYMVAGMGVGAYAAGAFHLVTHAYFKALLFLGSGAVILACHHNQDMRYMGALRKYLTFTKVTYFIGYLALIGTPFLFAGAYSKDAIIAGALDRAVGEGQWLYSLVFVFLLLGAFLTPFYMTRQMVMIFSGDKYRGDENPDAHGHGAPAAHGHDDHAEDHAAHAVADVLEAHGHDGHHEVAVDVHGHEAAAHEAHGHEDHHGGTPHEQPLIIYGPLVVLAIFTMTIGWLYSPHGAFLTNTSYRSMNPGSFGGAASVFSNSFYPKSWEHAEHEEAGAAGHEEAAPEVGMIKQSGAITPAAPHQWHVMVEFLVFILATAGAAMGYGVWGYKQPWVLGMTKDAFKVTPFGDWLFRLLNNKYYIDEFYGAYLITPFLLFTHLCRAFDTFVMDGIVNAAGRFWLGLTWLARWVDQLVVDGLVNGAAWAVQGSSRSIRFLQSGFVQNYFMVVVVSILVWLAYARSWNYHTTANAGQTSPEAALGSMGVPPETPPPGTTAPVAEAAPATPVVTPAATPAVAPVPAGATH
ncbi:MAG: proton-conducting transporter membrane subunit, partial [bacterium]